MVPRTRLLAADAEREAGVAALREHYVAGRLTLDELDARVAVVIRARTRGQIARAFARLPGAAPYRRARAAELAIATARVSLAIGIWLLRVVVLPLAALTLRAVAWAVRALVRRRAPAPHA